MYKRVIGIFIILLILLVNVWGCGSNNDDADKVDINVGLSALVALADNHISDYSNELEVLSMTKEVQSGAWAEIKGLLAEVEKYHVPGTAWFVLPDGSYYTVELDKTDKNLSDRAYFPSLMSGNNVLGDLVYSKSTDKKSLIAATPVLAEGTVIGALGTSIFLDDLSEILVEELELPDNIVFFATSETGEVVLHSEADFTELINPNPPENAVFATSSLTGWHFVLGFKGQE